jgi:hypothetical protein
MKKKINWWKIVLNFKENFDFKKNVKSMNFLGMIGMH